MHPATPAGRTILRPVLAAVLLLGAGTGAWLATRSRPRSTASVVRTATAQSVNGPDAAPPSAAPCAALVDHDALEAAVTPSAARPKLETPVETLPTERAILDRARAHLLSGEPTAALDDVEQHARLFRHGALGEERDALRVEALVAARRYEQARAAAARFRASYPRSMLGPAVDGALRTIP
jgi:hypothetical protein